MSNSNIIPIASRTVHGVPTKTVLARKLHEYLSVGRDYSNWIKGRITKYQFIEGEDYILTNAKTGVRSNVKQVDHYLTLDMAKELAMVENNEKGREARRYFIECEKRLINSNTDNSEPPLEFRSFMKRAAANASCKAEAVSNQFLLAEYDKYKDLPIDKIMSLMDRSIYSDIAVLPKAVVTQLLTTHELRQQNISEIARIADISASA